MAVQKIEKVDQKRDKRRSHDKLQSAKISVDKTSGELHFRHNITKNGYYRGKKIRITSKEESQDK